MATRTRSGGAQGPSEQLKELVDKFGHDAVHAMQPRAVTTIPGGWVAVPGTDQLYQGSAAAVASLARGEVGAPPVQLVINMAEELVSSPDFASLRRTGVDVLHAPLPDNARGRISAAEDALAVASAAMVAAMGEGKAVLVNCVAGISRSSTAVLWRLLEEEPELGLLGALARLQTANPAAYPSVGLMQTLARQHPACSSPVPRRPRGTSVSSTGSEAAAGSGGGDSSSTDGSPLLRSAATSMLRSVSADDMAGMAARGWVSAKPVGGGGWRVKVGEVVQEGDTLAPLPTRSSMRRVASVGAAMSRSPAARARAKAADHVHVPGGREEHLALIASLHVCSPTNLWARMRSMTLSIANLRTAAAAVVGPAHLSNTAAEAVLTEAGGNVDAAVGLLLMM